MIGWFSNKFRYSQCGSVNIGFVSLLLRFCQITVKGRLTQASKEKRRQALRGFFGGQVTERGRKQIPLLRQARLATKHHLQRCDNAWGSGTGLNIRHPGTSTEQRKTVQDSHVGLATGVAERLSFVEMP